MSIELEPEDATNRQLLLEIFRRLERMEPNVSHIKDSVDALVAEVAVLADVIGAEVSTLVSKLEAAQADDAEVEASATRIDEAVASLKALEPPVVEPPAPTE